VGGGGGLRGAVSRWVGAGIGRAVTCSAHDPLGWFQGAGLAGEATMRRTYRFECVDKFDNVRATANIDAESEDEACLKAEEWCRQILKGERCRTRRVARASADAC
jgi:hypothetical protein